MLIRWLQFMSDHISWVGFLSFAGISYWLIDRKSQSHQIAKKALVKAVKSNSAEPISLHPSVDTAKCLGCGSCTKVCPEGDILQIIHHKAVLVSPTKCVGHGECEKACPFDAISLVFGTKTRGKEIPRLTTNYETNVAGLYIAGELGGMGLIRNAVRQGSAAVDHAISNLDPSLRADYDILVVGAGPAGLSACLGAIAKNKTYICLEQNSFGGTVSNFPRQKIVMSQPAILPMVGKMQFEQNKVSKEELLAYWNDIRRRMDLNVREQEAFQSLKVENGVFHIQSSKAQYTAQKVILAMGVRGSPRRLGLPNEDLAKVTYNLIDPEQYQNRRVAIVGGGNAGVEAAQMLAKENLRNQVTLLVHGATLDRANEENIRIIQGMQSRGLVEIWFNSQVKKIEPDHLAVERGGKMVDLANDFLFVFIGAEMPNKFLMSLGIAIDKKFGEGLGASRPPGRVA